MQKPEKCFHFHIEICSTDSYRKCVHMGRKVIGTDTALIGRETGGKLNGDAKRRNEDR